MAQTRDFMLGVVVGSALGAAAAMLYAPMSGPETRGMLKDKATEAKERTSEVTQQVREKAAEVTHQAQARVGDLTGKVRSRAGDIGSQAQNVVERGREVIDRQKEAVIAAVDAGRHAYVEKQSELQQEVARDVAPAEPAAAGETAETGETTEPTV